MLDKNTKEAKSLRWLAVQFPKVENPKDDVDKMQNCINLYCTNAADLIYSQQAEIERLQNDLAISRKETKRYATRRAIECEDCAGCTQWNCDCANERAEALREVADRLDRKFAFCSDTQCISAKTIRKFIQDELKEMVGEDK